MLAITGALIVIVNFFGLSESAGFRTTGSFILGEYVSKNATTGASMVKTYYLSKMFKVDWMAAYVFCKDNEMTLATFTDQAEMENFIGICNKRFKDFGDIVEVHIGGFKPTGKTSKTNWYWYETGDKLNYVVPWHKDEPNNDMGTENCMSLIEGNYGQTEQTSSSNGYYFNDCHCYNMPHEFICQEVKPL